MKEKTILNFLCIFLIFLVPNVLAQNQPPVCRWDGYITIDGSLTSDTNIVLQSYTNGTLNSYNGTVFSNGFYNIHVPGNDGDNITFKIYGVSVNEGAQTWNCSAPGYHTMNLSMNRTADGTSCTFDGGCSGGYCVHNYCRSASTYCGDGYCDTGENTANCAADCGTTVTGGAAAEEEEEEETAVTDTQTIEDIIEGITAEDLGMTGTLTADDVDVFQVGDEIVTTATPTADIIDAAKETATTEDSMAVLEQIENAFNEGKSVSVAVSMSVYKVTSKETEQSMYVSKITLTLTAETDMEDVVIVEVIPKSVASNISELVFLGEQPAVLQSDPVVQWSFASVSRDETKEMSYMVKSKLTGIETTTLAMAGDITEPMMICTPGEKRCMNNEIQQCLSDGKTWAAIEICEYGCNSTTLTCNTAPGIAAADYTIVYIVITVVIVIIIIAGFMLAKRKQ